MNKETGHNDSSGGLQRSDADLAQLVARVAQAAQADIVLCITAQGALAYRLRDLALSARLMVATAEPDTCEALRQAGIDAIHLPLKAADIYHQVQYVLALAAQSERTTVGELVVCAVGANVFPDEGDLVLLTDVETGRGQPVMSDLLRLTNGVQSATLQAALSVARKIGRIVLSGNKRIGAIFMLGDSNNVLEGSRQLVPNPFHGHDDATRRLTNGDIHDAIVEFAKLDGAFVIRGDGYIVSAGVFLPSAGPEVVLPTGLGSRHTAAAASTARTDAAAVVVSATDGNVRVFFDGELLLQLDPSVPHDLVTAQ